MEDLGFILWLPVAMAGLWLLRWFAVFQTLLRVELRRVPYRRAEATELAPGVLEFLNARTWELESYGFAPMGYTMFSNLDDAPGAPARPALCLWHYETGTWALVGENENGDPSEPHGVSFWTYFEDGTVLASLNGMAHALLVVPESWEVLDDFAPSLEAQWRSYRARLSERLASTSASPMDLDGFIAASTLRTEETLDAGQRRGAVVQHRAGGEARLIRPLTAALFSLKLLRGSARVRRLALARQKARADAGEPASPPAPVELEANAYRRFEALLSHRARRPVWGYILVITGLIFSLSLLGVLNPRSVAVLAFVVLLHELGHYSAMRVFGYADATLFFIPFFGGAATGNKARVSLAEEVTVLLAGPVPGILLALLLRVLPPDPLDISGELSFTLLVINGLNLLPIFPLDGGKIVDALLFLRRPLFATLFRAVAALAFLGFGVYSSDPVLLGLGLLVGLLIPSTLKIARLERVLQAARHEPDFGARAPLDRVIEEMRALGLGSSPRASRFAMMRQVVQRMDRAPARLVTTLGWLTAHGASLGVAAFAFFGSGHARGRDLGNELRCDLAGEQAVSRSVLARGPERGPTGFAFWFTFPSEADARNVTEALGIRGLEGGSSSGMGQIPARLADTTESWAAWRTKDMVFLEVSVREGRDPAAIVGYFREAGCLSFEFRAQRAAEHVRGDMEPGEKDALDTR